MFLFSRSGSSEGVRATHPHEKELHCILDAVLRSVTASFETTGTISPFGVVLSTEGKLSKIACPSGTRQALEKGLRLLATQINCTGIGYCTLAAREECTLFFEFREGPAFQAKLRLAEVRSSTVGVLSAKGIFFGRAR